MSKPKLILGDTAIKDDRRAPPWQRSHGQFIAGQSEVTETDTLAAQMERTWGVGRLRLLVGPDLREKFDRQRYLLNQAVWHGDLEAVKREARRMRAAWLALDNAARARGVTPCPPTVWEVALDDGSVAAIVRDNEDAHQVIAEGRGMAVYTLAEIARLLSGFPEIVRAKEIFPGASVVAARPSHDPLDSIHDTSPALDDEVPY